VNAASHRASLAVLPILAGNDLVCASVRADPAQVFGFDFGLTVERQEAAGFGFCRHGLSWDKVALRITSRAFSIASAVEL
jgi:hypothetical protein